MHELELFLPRSAFTPREVARAGDLWRLFQDVAVAGSISAGWTPETYRAHGCSMIVRSMCVVHHRPTKYGEALVGRTWPSRVRRGTFFRRECRVTANGEPVASATQEWVHVATDGGAITVARAPDAMLEAFDEEPPDESVTLPAFEPIDPVDLPPFELECWHGWMDPLAHVNHPTYVDWCDEALSRALAARRVDPADIVPVAEELTFRSGVVAGERAMISSSVAGRTTEGHAVLKHAITVGDRLCARGTSVRTLATRPERLFAR